MAACSTALSKAPRASERDIEGLEDALGHRFSDRALLTAALRHSSLAPARTAKRGSDNFERLEFLGDRVVGLVIADLLLARFPGESEGDLASRHASFVSRRTLAEIADEIDLGQRLRLTRGEDGTGGRRKPTVLADSLEALIGAIYRDGGLEPARALIARLYASRLDEAGQPPRDPKTALQEWAQARGLPLPAYRIVKTEGPAHQPSFEIEVRVEGFEPVIAGGTSKQNAERAAAAALFAAIAK
jgi:ribonuclease-3